MSTPPWHSPAWALERDPERDPTELVTAAHGKGQMVMSIPSQVRLSAALEHGWCVHVPKLGNESCCESHCGWFCISLPTSGRAYIHQTRMAWYSSALADATLVYLQRSCIAHIGASKALYKGYSKGSGHLSFDGFDLWMKPALVKEFFYVRSV